MPTATSNPIHKIWQKFRVLSLVDTIFIVIRTVFPERVLTAKTFIVGYRDITDMVGKAEADARCRAFCPEDQERITSFDDAYEALRHLPARDWDGFVLELDGDVIATRWFMRHRYRPYDWLSLRLPAESIAVAHHAVDPAHRGQRLALRLRIHTARLHANQGIRCLFASTERTNIASRRDAARQAPDAPKPRADLLHFWFLRSFGWTLVGQNGKLRFGKWGSEKPLEIDLEIPADVPEAPC
jgi:GNAT superfamily N-acetyltransferase